MRAASTPNASLDAFARPEPATFSASGVPQQGPPSIIFERSLGARKVEVRRDEAAIIRKLAALAKSVGEGWCYRVPIRNAHLNRTEYIEGASIKLANDLARLYGNCDVETRVADLGGSWLITARFTDHETGFSLARPLTQKKPFDRQRLPEGDRAHETALQAGVSKAIRNVVVNALQSFAEFALSEAKGAVLGRIAGDLEGYRSTVTSTLTALIEINRVEAVIGRPAAAWLVSDLAWLISIIKAIGDGVITANEAFPAGATPPAPVNGTEDLNAFAAARCDGDAQPPCPDQPLAEPHVSSVSTVNADPHLPNAVRWHCRGQSQKPGEAHPRSKRQQRRLLARNRSREMRPSLTVTEAPPCL